MIFPLTVFRFGKVNTTGYCTSDIFNHIHLKYLNGFKD